MALLVAALSLMLSPVAADLRPRILRAVSYFLIYCAHALALDSPLVDAPPHEQRQGKLIRASSAVVIAPSPRLLIGRFCPALGRRPLPLLLRPPTFTLSIALAWLLILVRQPMC